MLKAEFNCPETKNNNTRKIKCEIDNVENNVSEKEQKKSKMKIYKTNI